MDPNKTYIQQQEKEIKDLCEQMDAIQKQIAELPSDEKPECRKYVKVFYEKMPSAYDHIETLKTANEADADKVKSDIHSSVSELKAMVEKAKEEVGN